MVPNFRRQSSHPHISVYTSCLAFFVVLLTFLPVQAAEVIKNFKSDIWVNDDASLTVREVITVTSEGNQIKRGIFRDFPTDYEDQYGNNVRVGFTVEKVTRDGQPEPFHITKQGNGVRVYIGDKNTFLADGDHTYSLSYRTTRQIGFFEDFDEIYWNVTGNGWAFTIDNASGRVHLPPGASVLNAAAYTGYQGERGSLYKSRQYSDGVEYYTTQPLGPKQGLTIAVSWPIGFIQKPTELQQAKEFLGENQGVIWGLSGIAGLVVYYMIVWSFVGRDPKGGTIIPLFEPPKGYSPAAMRYINKMGFDNKVFTTAVVSMAVKGFLQIREFSKGKYVLTKTGKDNTGLSRGERAVAAELFKGLQDSIEIEQSNHKQLGKAKKGLANALRTEFESLYFNKNTLYFVPGIFISFLVMVALIFWSNDREGTVFMAVWLSGWTVGIYFLGRRAWRAWQAALSGGGTISTVAAIISTVFAIPFVIGEFVGLSFFVELASPVITLLFVTLQIINVCFYHLLKAPTHLGRSVMDAFAGFTDFLSVTEKDRMNFHNPPDRTPELFEKFLPFAIALGVEQAWGEQFSGKLATASQGADHQDYHPGWYRGTYFNSGNFSDFSSSLGQSFSSSISAASTAPGSSSGSSGGGSSGGGGGGGGGGGW